MKAEGDKAEQEQLIIIKKTDERLRSAAVTIVILIILLLAALCVIAWLAWEKWNHIEEHNWRIKHREDEFKSTIADLREDIETLKNISYHKELQYNDTIGRLNEEIDLIEQIHDELVEAFEAHEIKCNETIADLEEEIMNMTNLIPLAAEALTSGGIANLLQSTQRMYIMVLFMLSIYFSFRLKNFEW